MRIRMTWGGARGEIQREGFNARAKISTAKQESALSVGKRVRARMRATRFALRRRAR